MPQDQFDNWLRSRVDSESPVDGADREWAMIQYRLQRDRKKRRGMFWWWSGLGVLLLLMISIAFISQQDDLNYTQNFELDEIAIKDKLDLEVGDQLKKGSVDQKSYVSDDKLAQDVKKGASQILHEIVNNETAENSGNKTKKDIVEAEDGDQNEVSTLVVNEYIDREITNENKIVSPRESVTIRESNSIGQPKENRVKISKIDLLPIKILTHLYINEELNILNDREDQKPSFARGNSQKWQLEMGLFGGWSSHIFSDGNAEWRDVLNRHETSKEQMGVEILAWRKIAPGWFVGSGLGYRYSHRQLSQFKLDTMSSQSADQLLGLLEDADGQIRTYSGAGQGQAIVEVDRELHMQFHELRIPIGIQYQKLLSDRWVIHSGVMMVPGVYFQRSGRSIDQDPTSLRASEIADRYESDLTLHSRIRAGLDYRISSQLQLGVGLQWEKQWNDTKLIDGMMESGQGVHLTLGVKMNLK